MQVRFGLKADLNASSRHVAYVPGSDICNAAYSSLLDHLVGEREQPIRHVEAKRVLQGVKTVIIDENGKAVAPS